MNRPRIAENFSPEAVINQRFQATRWNLIFSSFLLAHCGRMSERSKESPAEIAGGYLSIYVYAYILGMTRNAARLIENINDFSRFFPRTNDTYASGYWYVVQDTWQLDVSAKNVWKPLSCARVCDTTIARSIRAASLRSDLEPHPRSILNLPRKGSPFRAACAHFWMEIFPMHDFLFPPLYSSSTCFPFLLKVICRTSTWMELDSTIRITRVVLVGCAIDTSVFSLFIVWVCRNNRYPHARASP